MEMNKLAMSIASISGTKHATPFRAIIHGLPGIGKSSMAAGAKNAIFIQTEDGLNGIDAQAFPLCESYQDVLDCLRALCEEDHPFETVVIDSADWLETFIHRHVCEVENVTSIEKAAGGYGKGYLEANNHWRNILNALDYLNRKKKMAVILICHTRVVQFNDPLHEPYDKYEMKLHSPKSGNGSNNMLVEWADIIGFCDQEKFVSNKGTSDKKINRATLNGERFIHLVGSPAFVAKNRFGLPEKLPLNYEVFEQALNEARK